MKKDATIFFMGFFIAFVVFALLFAQTINTVMVAITDLDSIFSILSNLGITGYFYSTMSFVCFIFSVVFAIKSIKN